MSAAELLVILDRENAIVRKLTARDLRAGTGPSQEMKAARAQAVRTWHLWSNALDLEAGRAPCFPVDAAGRLLAVEGGAR
jgi:hypothetical protein